jgi:hypothetical protein
MKGKIYNVRLSDAEKKIIEEIALILDLTYGGRPTIGQVIKAIAAGKVILIKK